MSEIKITKNSLENTILKDGLIISGYVDKSGTINASGYGAHAEGYIEGYISDEGDEEIIDASGYCAHAEGHVGQTGSIIANGTATHAEGYAGDGSINANGVAAHAEGYVFQGDINASGNGAFARGYVQVWGSINANGNAAHAEGYAGDGTINASGNGTIAMGYVNGNASINARGNGAFVCGIASGGSIDASGNGAHAEGINTQALGNGAHAGGVGTIANQEAMTAIGKYNKTYTDLSTLFVVGDGQDNTSQHNVFEVIENSSYSTKAKVNGVSDVYLGCPIGTVVMWAGQMEEGTHDGDLPYGWLLCNGDEIPLDGQWLPIIPAGYDNKNIGGRTFNEDDIRELQALVNVIGVRWRLDGDIENTRLPNFQQKFPLGAKDESAWQCGNQRYNTNLGHTGGEKEHKLTINEMPSHAHKLVVCAEDYNLTNTGGCHAGNNSSEDTNDWLFPAGKTPSQASTGGDEPHNNIPPYLAINFIIKYK